MSSYPHVYFGPYVSFRNPVVKVDAVIFGCPTCKVPCNTTLKYCSFCGSTLMEYKVKEKRRLDSKENLGCYLSDLMEDQLTFHLYEEKDIVVFLPNSGDFNPRIDSDVLDIKKSDFVNITKDFVAFGKEDLADFKNRFSKYLVMLEKIYGPGNYCWGAVMYYM